MAGQQVQLKKTVVVTVMADKVAAINATTESGAVVPVSGPISVGDYNIVDESGNASILSAADFAAELVPVAGGVAA